MFVSDENTKEEVLMRKYMVINTLILVTMIIFNSSVFAISGFSDVDGSKYEKAVEKLVELGIINGFDDNTFRPNNNVTRAQLAKMLVVALKMENAKDEVLVNGFSDVTEGHWAYSFIGSAVNNGLINGYTDGTFRPDNNVTYAESMAMILRAMKLEEKMTDKTWPSGYINEAKSFGLLDSIDYSDPNNPANRGDTAISLYNMLNNIETQNNVDVSSILDGKYINNIDGYMELTLKKIDNDTVNFYFVGYKNGGIKGGNDNAKLINGVGIFERDFFDEEEKITFEPKGNIVVVSSPNEKFASFIGEYKVDDGTITSIETTNKQAINAVYTKDGVEVHLEEVSNNEINFSLSGVINDSFLGIGCTLNYSDGIASMSEEAFGNTEKISIKIESDKIIIDAFSSNPESSYNKINGTYLFKENAENDIESYKNKLKGFWVAEGGFMY